MEEIKYTIGAIFWLLLHIGLALGIIEYCARRIASHINTKK